MLMFLGNLSASQAVITFSEADRAFMDAKRQEKINDTPLEAEKWRCYETPLMLVMQCDQSCCHETFQAGWGAEDGK